MRMNRFIVGVLFNKRMFRLQSLKGLIIDEILEKKLSSDSSGQFYFTHVTTPDVEGTFILINGDSTNYLAIHPDQVVFRKAAISEKASVNYSDALDEFDELWGAANKIIKFPAIRRIGLVAEHRIDKKGAFRAGGALVECTTRLRNIDKCSKFRLEIESRSATEKTTFSNIETDDFYNTIYNFYTSDIDETPQKDSINANIDCQRYYNPARIDLKKELRLFKEKFREEKDSFKKTLIELGLENNVEK